MFIVFEINLWSNDLNGKFTLLNFLFGSVTLTKNIDSDKISYSWCDIGFDERRAFSLSVRNEFANNLLIFGVDTGSSLHADNRTKDSL